ncbi:hypothetical protein ACOME3_002714 [Neoechinorhynchus agilis]
MYPIRSIMEDLSRSKQKCNEYLVVGFSKGCVVLNRIVDEYDFCDKKWNLSGLVWLDGGHCGLKDFWPESLKVPERIRMDVMFSNYQLMKGGKRMEEFNRFLGMVRRRGGSSVDHVWHLANSLYGHFGIIDYFTQEFTVHESKRKTDVSMSANS